MLSIVNPEVNIQSIVFALTCSHSSSSPRVESNQSNVTCFDLIRSHETCLLVRRQEVGENSACSHGHESHNNSLVAQLKISEASEKSARESQRYVISKYKSTEIICCSDGDLVIYDNQIVKLFLHWVKFMLFVQPWLLEFQSTVYCEDYYKELLMKLMVFEFFFLFINIYLTLRN